MRARLIAFLLAIGSATADETEFRRAREWILRTSEDRGLVEVRSIGTSVEGRDLSVLRISRARPGAPGVYLGGSIHGREFSHKGLLAALDRVLGRRDDPDVRRLLATRVLWVQPMMNPDGVAHTTRKNARGVDLNRNFGYRWGENWSRRPGPDDDRYIGERPFCEPESRAVAAFLRAQPSIGVYFDVHGSSRILFTPFGGQGPPPSAGLMDLYAGLDEAMGRYNQGRDPRIVATVSSGSGYTIDWVHGILGAAAFTLVFPGDPSAADLDALADGIVHLLERAPAFPREARWY